MAAEKTIVAKLFTPIDENTGERKMIIFQTTPENVIDPETGQTMSERMDENTYGDATPSSSGLMTPTQVTNLNTLFESKTVVSEDDPGVPCMWFQVEGIETES